jgi:SAM-dependent methyltransferase
MGQTSLLFNVKTIERLCADVKITQKQRQAAKEWLALLDTGKLEDEKSNYPKFMQIILQDILGYPIKEINYESGNVEFQFSSSEGKSVLCFEAKGTSVQDLFAPQHRAKKEHETPIKQTWDYMGSLALDYGICTNYKDFVLITKQHGYSKYHIFDFNSIKKNEEKLKEFIGIFSKERIIDKGFVEKLHKESIIEEREFTKEFYKLFHETRLMMIKAFQEKDEVSKDEAIRYAQMYLNRLIFMFFAEDHGFLEDKLFTRRVTEVLNSPLISEHSKMVSDEILGLFQAMDKGSHRLGIFGFNGGLFQDQIPTKIYFQDLKDEKFFKDVRQHSKLKIRPNEETQKIIDRYQNELNPIIVNLLMMDSFDFTTEVNVNILGHIFEQSISDLEELRGDGVSRRKKEGVYYTPEYITDYICRNTIIPYLSKSGTNSIPELIKEYNDNIGELEKKFKEIKILDPACGSGAFLVKAVDILLEIHKEIQIVKESMGEYATGSQFQLTKWNEEAEARIFVEHNIYGVDINEESVEITKLSLFLKIASKHRKLSSLKNIKIGNSLIDDKNIDLRAFDPEVMGFEKFDIVIGNPPYVRNTALRQEQKQFFTKFESAFKQYDLYVLFIEQSINNLRSRGFFGYIIPNKILSADYGTEIRKLILKNCSIISIVDVSNLQVFKDASTYPILLFLKNSPDKTNKVKILKTNSEQLMWSEERYIPQDDFVKNEDFTFLIHFDEKSESIVDKIEKNSIDAEVLFDVRKGIETGNDKELTKVFEKKPLDNKLKPVLGANTIGRYYIDWNNRYVVYDPDKLNGARKSEYFEKEKLVTGRTVKRLSFALDLDNFYTLDTTQILIPRGDIPLKTILGLMNSKLINFYYSNKFKDSHMRGGYVRCYTGFLNKIPIHKNYADLDKIISDKVQQLISNQREYLKLLNKFLMQIQVQFSPRKLSKKLLTFYELTFSEFVKIINNSSKRKMTLREQDEWKDYFDDYSSRLYTLKTQIDEVDIEIDNVIYDFYQLNKSEIDVIEAYHEK